MEIRSNAHGASAWLMQEQDQEVTSKPAAGPPEAAASGQAAEPDGAPASRSPRSIQPFSSDQASTIGRLSGPRSTSNSTPTAQPGSDSDFLGFVKQEGRRLLEQQFPGQRFDPDRVYVNQRDPDAGTVSFQTLTTTLMKAVQDGSPTSYDLSQTGLFHSQDWNEQNRVARGPRAHGSSNAIVDIEEQIVPKLLNDPTTGSLETRYQDHVRQRQYPLASNDERAQLRQFEGERQDDEAAVNRLLGETVSPQRFARQQVQDRVWQETGVTIDPDRVKVIAESGAGSNRPRSEHTLTEAALRGPFSSSTQFSLAPQRDMSDGERAALTPAFLTQMLGEQDVRADYLKAQEVCFNHPDMAAATTDTLASRAQQSAYGAKLKGSLTEGGYNLIQRTRQSPDVVQKPDVTNTLGGVTMFGGDQLKDVQVYRETNQSDRSSRYVMYAPGAPDGEYHEFNNWRALNQQIGKWTGSEAGRQYLTNQLDPANRETARKYFDQAAQRPAEWSTEASQWKEFSGGPSYRGQLGDAEAERRRTTLAESRAALQPSMDPKASPHERKQFNTLRLAAESAQQTYQSTRQPAAFRKYAHTKIQEGLNARLREHGVTQSLDPDKVEVDVGGDGTTKMSLTNLITYGYREQSGLNVEKYMKFRSTDGQDVSALNAPEMRTYIDAQARRSYIGEKYVNDTTVGFLSEGPALEEKRQLHQTATQATLQRDAYEAKLKGELSKEQYASLKPLIDQWSLPDTASRADIASGKAPGVHALELNGKTVQGTYAFHMPGVSGTRNADLVYTPGAPDGVAFRTYAQVTASLGQSNQPANRAMADYFYDRVNYTDKTEIGKLVERTRRNLDPGVQVKGGDRISGNTGQEYDRSVRRLTGDVSATTKTRGEVIAEQAWKGLSYAAAAVTFPFPLASAAVGVFSAGKSFADGFQSYADGDRAAAFGDFVSGGLDLAGAAGDLLGSGLKGGGTLLKQAAKRRPGAIDASNASSSSAVASNVGNVATAQTSTVPSSFHTPLPSGRQTIRTDGYMSGVIDIQAQGDARVRSFVRDGNGYLEVMQDKDKRTLRLIDPRKREGNSQSYFEPIVKNENEQWVFTPPVGLKGGNPKLVTPEEWARTDKTKLDPELVMKINEEFEFGSEVFRAKNRSGETEYLLHDPDENIYIKISDNETWSGATQSDPSFYEYSLTKRWEVNSDSVGKSNGVLADGQEYTFVPLEKVIPGRSDIPSGDMRTTAIENRIKQGQKVNPIDVTQNADGTYSITNGNHRLVAARNLRLETIPVSIVRS
ncbi:ParB/RepB/Spo0J family partition protein [Burkholderia cepacia]|nr:ParB/RepB/Spo0J family partition protein [Burkholderia cepacia]